MKDYRMQKYDKSRVAHVNTSDVCLSAVIGVFALWLLWVSSSLLIHFVGV